MNKFQKRVITALTTGSILLQTALPAFSATTELVISGNGSDSESDVKVAQQSQTNVVQSNNTNVENKINVNTNTGNNQADDNTGGDVLVRTGDADVEVNVMNQLNTNSAVVEACDCDNDTLLKISGNGTGTENDIDLYSKSATNLFQNNVANVKNDVKVQGKTGDNSADDNTGGNVVIRTGDVDVEVNVGTLANANSARIMPRNGSEGGSVTLLIEGNGSDSENEIDVALKKATLLTQNNLTSIRNRVDVDAKTGNNDAEDNTGGTVGILTGDVDMEVNVMNEAGFNWADLDCDCLLGDVLGKISGNGTDSENEIKARLESLRDVYQVNECGYGQNGPTMLFSQYSRSKPCFDNDISLDGYTGNNDADDNTGAPGDDPLIITGDADVEVNVSNAGGSNVLGNASDWDWDWPSMGSGVNLSLSFDLSALLALLLAQ